jgi:large subunit ribosomal protein L20
MRTRSNVARHKRRRRILKAAKGFRGARKNQLRIAKDGVMRAMNYAYVGRKLRKRDFRALWIQRINAAARQNGMTYSELMGRLGKTGVGLDRKALSELAVTDPAAFTRVVETARAAG